MTRHRQPTGPRETIKIDAEVYALLVSYSEATGVSITRTITDAVRDWMETVGVKRLEYMGKRLE